MSVRHYALWTAMFWTNSTIAWRYYVILRNNLRWIFAGFLIVSWQLLDIFLGLGFLKTSSWYNFFPSRIVKSTQDMRHRQEANETQTRLLRYRQEVTRYANRQGDKISQIVTNIFEIFKKILGASRFIKNCQEVSRSCSRSLQEDIRKCQDLKFCTIRVELRIVGPALVGQPEIHQIINTNLTRIKGNNIRGKKKIDYFFKPHAWNLIRVQLIFLDTNNTVFGKAGGSFLKMHPKPCLKPL